MRLPRRTLIPASPPRATARRPAARGFTVIELMVVVAIIAILLGIVVVGYKHVGTGTQKAQTRTLMERLRNVSTGVLGNKTASTKFFQVQIPYVYEDAIPPAIPPDPAKYWDAVPANANDSLYRTGLILKALVATPEGKAIFDDVPAERKKVYYFRTDNYKIVPGPGVTIDGPFTLPLDAWGNPLIYVFDNWQIPTGGGTARPRPNAAGTDTAGGLTDLISESAKTYWALTTPRVPADPAYASKYQTPMTPYTRAGDALRAPDHLPFWASAGPDGNYATHDDNVYSFEN